MNDAQMQKYCNDFQKKIHKFMASNSKNTNLDIYVLCKSAIQMAITFAEDVDVMEGLLLDIIKEVKEER